MGLLEALIGVIAIGWIGSLFGGSSNDSSEDSSEGYHNLHNEADRHSSHIALNNCENCGWHENGSCRWQENCYAKPSKYHEYICDNYKPK